MSERKVIAVSVPQSVNKYEDLVKPETIEMIKKYTLGIISPAIMTLKERVDNFAIFICKDKESAKKLIRESARLGVDMFIYKAAYVDEKFINKGCKNDGDKNSN